MNYLAAGGLIKARIAERIPQVKRVEEIADLYARLEEGEEAMARYISGQAPAVFVGFDGEQLGDMTADGAAHVAHQRWLVVLAVKNYRTERQDGSLQDEAGELLTELLVALAGWQPEGFTELRRQAAPRPGYLAGVGFFPLVFSTAIFLPPTN